MANISIPLFFNQAHSCDYLSGERAQTLFVDPRFAMTTRIYSKLIAQGFRRSGDLVYRPHCEPCAACIPIRIPIDRFTPDRNQRRTLKVNLDLYAAATPPVYNDEHYALYQRYLRSRHGDGSMADSTTDDYVHFLTSRWCKTLFAEFRVDKVLAAVSVIDVLDDALSAVYTFFDPGLAGRSLGTYAVLWQIGEAQRRGLSHLYLGYWIKKCRKMSYKVRFRPYEAYIEGRWRPYKKGEEIEG